MTQRYCETWKTETESGGERGRDWTDTGDYLTSGGVWESKRNLVREVKDRNSL